MIIENGKRYVRADGETTGMIECNHGSSRYPCLDPTYHITYTIAGKVYDWGVYHPRDLVSEHVEPPQYGPWIPWAGGECPVADGTMGQVQLDDEGRTEVEKETPIPIYQYNWEHTFTGGDIIYYRVLIEEPEATTDVIWVSRDGRTWSTRKVNSRKAIITVQGDSIKAEWAPKEDKE